MLVNLCNRRLNQATFSDVFYAGALVVRCHNSVCLCSLSLNLGNQIYYLEISDFMMHMSIVFSVAS